MARMSRGGLKGSDLADAVGSVVENGREVPVVGPVLRDEGRGLLERRHG